MNRDMLMEQIDDVAQRLLDLDIIRPDCLEGMRLMIEASSFLMR